MDALLRDDVSSLRALCILLAPDYACFGYAMPPECAAENLGPKKCGGTKFDVRELDDHGQPLTKCNDYQEVRIQEQVHRLTVGSIPRSITIVLQDDLVDRCKAGDDVTIVGLLRKRWKPPAPSLRNSRPSSSWHVGAAQRCGVWVLTAVRLTAA